MWCRRKRLVSEVLTDGGKDGRIVATFSFRGFLAHDILQAVRDTKPSRLGTPREELSSAASIVDDCVSAVVSGVDDRRTPCWAWLLLVQAGSRLPCLQVQPERPFMLDTFMRPLAALAASMGLVSAVVVGCGGEAALVGPERVSDTPDAARADNGASDDELADKDERPSVGLAPGMVPVTYPQGPFGTKLGATIENLAFYGWRDPSASSFELNRAETIRLSDYYNPGAAGEGIEYILLNVVASWCGVCRSEYTQLAQQQVYAALSPRGLQIMGVLYEDNNSDPSRLVDMLNWAQAFSVSFPFVNDPGFKTGRYFDRSATPMNMLIDARTMKIVQVGTGYRPDMFEQIGLLLQQRGR